MLPSIFGENLFDDFFGDSFEKEFFGNRNPVFGKHGKNMMKTDVKELEDCYELDVDLPGFQKDEVYVSVQDGYLTIQATANNKKDEKDDKGKYIRRERYSGSCSRSFYVGDQVTEADIKAKFEDGTLKLLIPKKEEKPAVEEKKYIAIEG